SCSASSLTFNRPFSIHLIHPLPNSEQPESIVLFRENESATVVAHFQAHGVLFKGQLGLKYFRIGMFERIGQSLLLNAQQVFLNCRHQPARLAMDGELTSKSRSRRHLLDQAVQGDTQIAILQRLWTERSDRPAGFAET